MSSGKAWPPRMYANLEDWERVYQSCDLGDGYSLSIYAHPHWTEQVPHMIKLMSVEEHSALIAEKDKEIAELKECVAEYEDEYAEKVHFHLGLEKEIERLKEMLAEYRAREALAGRED